MNDNPSSPTITERELEDLLQLTIENQRAEGIVLTPQEIVTVRNNLRKQHGFDGHG